MLNLDKELICFGDLHFKPNEMTCKEVTRCLGEPTVFVAVISNSYCESDFCQMEIEEAKTSGKPVILIFMEHVSEDKIGMIIRQIFRNFTRIRFIRENGELQIEPSWPHVCEAIIKLT